MDMQQMQPGDQPAGGGDAKAILTQAKALIDKALAAMGGEAEPQDARKQIAAEVFGNGGGY